MRAARRLPQPIEGKRAAMYVIKYVSVMTEEDVFNKGCIPNTGWNWNPDMKDGEYRLVREALNAISEENGWDPDKVEWQNRLDFDEEKGTFEGMLTVDENGTIPTENKYEAWKRGECKLYAANVYAKIVWREDRELTEEECRI